MFDMNTLSIQGKESKVMYLGLEFARRPKKGLFGRDFLAREDAKSGKSVPRLANSVCNML